MKSVTILINGKSAYECSREELHEAFEVLSNAHRLMKQRAALNFYPGQYVSFKSRRGMRVIGQIEKINKTSVTLHEVNDTHHKWRVSASLLTLYNGE